MDGRGERIAVSLLLRLAWRESGPPRVSGQLGLIAPRLRPGVRDRADWPLQLHPTVGAEAVRISEVEKCCHQVDALQEAVKSLKDTFQKFPAPEELSQCVTWDVMQSSLLSEREILQKDLVNSGLIDRAKGIRPTHTPFHGSFTAANTTPSHTSTPSSPRPTAPGSLDTEAPSVPSGPPQQTDPETDGTAAATLLPRKASGSERYTETVDALRNMGKLRESFSKLEARVAALEQGKLEPSQLKLLKELITNKGSRNASNNMMDQLNQQKALIDNLMKDREKNGELVNDVQNAILQLQTDCEKLTETTRFLHEDNSQKQSHIEELYKTTEELEEKKADKQMVESEIKKAAKYAPDGKVSRLQFDSVTEQLNAMFQELLNKVTGQEQDWHKVIERLSSEMECKLNRIELNSVKKQLEDRWRSHEIHEKLQGQGAPEQEDAAGIRKQLVDRFHCLSCDRPVVMHNSGQHVVKLSSTAGFPSHRSIRPFTVYALEQFRQHYRRMKPGSNRYSFEGVTAGWKREQLQKSHDVMCRQIESDQRTMKNCNTAGDNLNQNQPGILHERVSEMTDYSHLAVLRSCGGSHTVTSASQRRTNLQTNKYPPQAEVDCVIQSEEVDIVGLDGHIYKGRLNAPSIRNTETKLPTIPTKDGMCKTKDKAKCPHKPTASPEGHHPHSAKSNQGSHSASSLLERDWPVSALGCTSQSSVAAAESNTEPPAGAPLNL
ncbi:glutamine-rich protein 2 isoform X3 [Gymnodraco acuticeps]|uniref:Glutamine-rich protein 2 isoform X3 n=1 Tax=Gymnodraco acuticeps TaxID=8218 RepID=A0A6P8TUF0_GYMAC|nr:glutamine-rich protein 2 isoform X3 [Gymnodraco acuticeps]